MKKDQLECSCSFNSALLAGVSVALSLIIQQEVWLLSQSMEVLTSHALIQASRVISCHFVSIVNWKD